VSDAASSAAEAPLEAVFGPRGEAVLRLLADEWFLVPVRTTPADFRAIFAVNEVGATVWQSLDGARPLTAVLDAVVERFEVTREEAERDLREFLVQLEGAGLVERRS
jgi:hypothetical protein